LANQSSKQIAIISYLSFVFSGLGVAVISYFLGGIVSDYYFGVLIISFLQFTFVPLAKRWSILLDFIYIIFFFGLNTYNHDYDQALLVRQVSNYLSFALFKFIAVNRSRKHIYDSIENISLLKELNSRTNVQNIFGELCHLINNPLFISTNVTKKAMKNIPPTPENVKTHKLLTKSLTAQYRIGTVIEKMLSLQSDKEVDINQYKEFLTTEVDLLSEEIESQETE
jgi:hypothetical protein